LLNYIRKGRDITLFDNFAKEIAESQFWEFNYRLNNTATEINSHNDNSNDTEYFCKNIGCYMVMTNKEKDKKGGCVSHKGSFTLGNSKFQGHWSCCSKPWDSKPCTTGEHSLIAMNSHQAQTMISNPLWPDYKAL